MFVVYRRSLSTKEPGGRTLFLTSRQVVSASDWNAVFDHDIYRNVERADVKPFRVFIDWSNLVDKFRNEYPVELV